MKNAHLLGLMSSSAAVLCLAVWGLSRPGAADEHRGSWKFAGGDIHDTRSGSADRQLAPDRVARLSPRWVFTTAGNVSATPTVENGALYVPDWGGMIYKIDVATGQAAWSRKVADYTGNAKSFSRNSPAIGERAIIFGDQAGGVVMAVDKKTGELIWKTTVDPHPAAWITSSPVIFNDRIYVGVASQEETLASKDYVLSFRGSVVALDLKTGTRLWQFTTVPEDYTGGAVVGGNLVIDEQRNALYAATGNNYGIPATAAACLKTKTTMEEQQKCLDPENYVDTVVSLDLADGHLKWAARTLGFDTWTGNCVRNKPLCPDPAGPDYDFASAPNLFHVGGGDGTAGKDILGIGQKNGIYWAFSPDDGRVVWSTKVGPAGPLGGIEWGSAVEDGRLYVAITNIAHKDYPLGKEGQMTKGGAWNALDAATGEILWQTPTTGNDPKHPELGSLGFGAVSAANGVMYAGTTSGDMVALDGKTGKLLWQFASGGTVAGGPAIVGDTLYWGSGYTNRNMGSIPNNRLYAFSASTPGDREANLGR